MGPITRKSCCPWGERRSRPGLFVKELGSRHPEEETLSTKKKHQLRANPKGHVEGGVGRERSLYPNSTSQFQERTETF